MQARELNKQALLEALCCAGFGGVLLHSLYSGTYLNYVTPRMLPWLLLADAVLFLWTIGALGRLLQPQHRVRTAHCLVLLLPALLLLVPQGSYAGNQLTSGYGGSGAFVRNGTPSSAAAVIATPAITAPGSEMPSPTAETVFSGLSGLDAANRTITISDDEFYPWLVELYANTDRYLGYTITMTGFVFRDENTFAPGQFVPARLAMTCCAADLTPVGMLCKYEKAASLETDSWIMVEGTLFIGEFDGQEEPQIQVTKVIPAQEVPGYIYPY